MIFTKYYYPNYHRFISFISKFYLPGFLDGEKGGKEEKKEGGMETSTLTGLSGKE